MKILSTIQPTKNQLTVLAIIAANQEKPNIIQQLLSHNQNLVMAKNLLMQFNAIEIGNHKVKLTDIGNSIAKDNDIIDDTGQLTDRGQQLIPSDTNSTQTMSNSPVDLPTGEPGMDEFNTAQYLPPMEGFSSLFRSALLG